MTRDERHAEITRLRAEYLPSALPRECGAKLMQLPEPESTDAVEAPAIAA